MYRQFSVFFVLLFVPIFMKALAEPISTQEFLDFAQFKSVQLSPDGSTVFYQVSERYGEEKSAGDRAFLQDIEQSIDATELKQLDRARGVTWSKDSQRLFYQFFEDGEHRISSIRIADKSIEHHVLSEAPILSFSVADDGSIFSWITLTTDNAERTIAARLSERGPGIRFLAESASVFDFVFENMPDGTSIPATSVWVGYDNGSGSKVELPGNPLSAELSPNGQKLAVQFVSQHPPSVVGAAQYTSVGIFHLESHEFDICAQSVFDDKQRLGDYYDLQGWRPDSTGFIVRKTVERIRWWRYDTFWTLFDGDCAEGANANWVEQDRRGGKIEYSGDRLFIHQSDFARRSVFHLTTNKRHELSELSELPGDVSAFSFDAEGKSGVFLYSEFGLKPELYYWREDQAVRQVTSKNEERQNDRRFEIERVNWPSTDGEIAHGWLLVPHENADALDQTIIVFLHGGPAIAVKNRYADYLRTWPMPIEVLASYGIPIFIPNYRGTSSFGQAYVEPSGLDKEAIQDVLSGIEFVSKHLGIDAPNIGLMGHSHGGWLAGMIVAEKRDITAAYIAESSLNKFVTYSAGPRYLNVDVHQKVFGGSPVDDPDFYINASPELRFEGVSTALLLEGGGAALAYSMIGAQNAAIEAGMPTEFIIYPKASHNIRRTETIEESINRSMSWFRFWLLGVSDGRNDVNTDQFQRWREMLSQRCEVQQSSRPSYCEEPQ